MTFALVCFVYFNAISCVHVYEWQIAPRAFPESSTQCCTSQRLYDNSFFFFNLQLWWLPVTDIKEWLVFMSSLLLHSKWARLSWSSGGIYAHMTGQANLRPCLTETDSQGHQEGNKIHNAAFYHCLRNTIIEFVIRLWQVLLTSFEFLFFIYFSSKWTISSCQVSILNHFILFLSKFQKQVKLLQSPLSVLIPPEFPPAMPLKMTWK